MPQCEGVPHAQTNWKRSENLEMWIVECIMWNEIQIWSVSLSVSRAGPRWKEDERSFSSILSDR